MKQIRALFLGTLGLTCVVGLGTPVSAQVVTDIAPIAGEVGHGVLLTGSGFDSAETYTIHFNGGAATPSATVLADSLTFTIPPGARSGRIQIETDSSGTSVMVGVPLTVLRQVPVQIDPGLASVTTGYRVGSIYGEALPNALVPIGEPGFAVAFGPNDDDPLLLGVATENTTSLTLNADTTASALIMFTPYGHSADPVEAESRLTTLDAMAEVQSLSTLIDSNLAAGTDFLTDAAFRNSYISAIDAFVQTLPDAGGSAASAGGGGGGGSSSYEDDFVQQDLSFTFATPLDLSHDAGTLPPKRVNVEAVSGVVIDPDEKEKPKRKIRFEAQLDGDGLFNPLDWIVAVYEINPWEWDYAADDYLFANGGADLENLTMTNKVFSRLNTGEPLGYAVLPQESVAQEINTFKILSDRLLKDIAIAPDPSLLIPSDRPGLYIVRAVSGAYWSDQFQLVEDLPDGPSMMTAAVALNSTLLALDYVSVAFPLSDISKEKSLGTVAKSAMIAALSGLSRDVAQEDLSAAEVAAMVRDVGTTVVSSVVTTALKNTTQNGFKAGAVKGLGRCLLVGVSIFDAVGSFGKVNIRQEAMFNTGLSPKWFPLWGTKKVASTVESAVIAIGDPWAPWITDFEPRSAYPGQTIRIQGRNFSYTNSENAVTFDGPGGPIQATVIYSDETHLHVKAPPGAAAGNHPISIATPWGSGTTTVLPAPKTTIQIKGNPLIAAVDPAEPIANVPFRLIGSNYPDDPARVRVKVLASLPAFDTYDLEVLSTTDGQLRAAGFYEVGLHTIRVQILDEDSQMIKETSDFLLNVTLAAGQSAPAGVIITVNSLADNLLSDDWVTLREALRWATEGTSFRAPSANEALQISGNLPAGPVFHADYIAFTGLASTDVIVLDPVLGPLPSVGDFDQMAADVSITVDGAGMTGDGLILDLIQGATIQRMTFRNFDGHCVRLSTATQNKIKDVIAEDCSGDGFRLENASTDNSLVNVESTLNGSDGIHLNGAGTQQNTLWYNFDIAGRSAREIADNAAYGVRVDGGAGNNIIHPGDIRRNQSGGIWVDGSTTTDNFLGYPYRAAGNQMFMEITDNVGPGLRTNASRTSMRYLRVNNNGNDGILLEGSSHTGSSISSTSVGFDSSGAANGNTESGIHLRGQVSKVRIGEEFTTLVNAGPPNEIGDNGIHGIWLEGPDVHDVTIDNTRIGATVSVTSGVPPVAGNAQHGIAITNGAHDNVLGHANDATHLEIVAHASGAGIYIDGPATRGNTIIGNHFGAVHRDGAYAHIENFDATLGNQYGIWIKNQAWDNTIGERGWKITRTIDTQTVDFNFSNYFYESSEAGILIESGSDPSQTFPPGGGEPPRGANIVQNNVFSLHTTVGLNKYGIILRGPAYANRIGGAHYAESNSFNNFWKAAVWIDGVNPSSPVLSNRIINNGFWRATGFAVPSDPLEDPSDGMGILVTNSSNQLIGGGSPVDQNVFSLNNVAIHVDQSDSITIRHNAIGISTSFTNKIGGVILSDSTNCTVGPGNQIRGNGTPDPARAHGGISILRGGQHTIEGNFVGMTARSLISAANQPWGILVRESSGNRIGRPGTNGSNVIVATIGDGVRLEGNGTTANQVLNNWIGVRPQDFGVAANTGIGVVLAAGASGNTIGGTTEVFVDASQVNESFGNRIHGNAGGGIVADGATTSGNSYLHNSITGHSTTAIQNLNGANGPVAPPTITMVDNETVIGTTTGVPTGSFVQVFSDADDEGEVWVADALTQADGSFEAPIMARHEVNLRATVTDGATGSTSELGSAWSLPATVVVAVDGAVTPTANADSGASGVVVLPLVLDSMELSSEITEVTVQATGSLYDPTGITAVHVYSDANGDGLVGANDVPLGGPMTFASDDGSVTIPLTDGLVSRDASGRWLIAVDLSPGATVGTTFGVEVSTSSSIVARTAFTKSPLPVSGSYPFAVAPLIVTPGNNLAAAPELTVSSDPADGANFIDLQTAVDTVGSPGARIRILPGLTGSYADNIVIQSAVRFSLSGGNVVTIDGTTGTAVTVNAGSAEITVTDLTLSGTTGITAHSPTRLDGLTFSGITNLAVDLQGGSHRVEDCVFVSGNYGGMHVAAAATVVVDRTRMNDLGDTGIHVLGGAAVRSTLLEGGTTGVLVEAGGSVSLEGSTVADHSLAGVDMFGGAAGAIDTSILWGNLGGDYLGGLCTEMGSSLSGSPDCSGSNGNLSSDPLFVAIGTDYRLAAGSPALDAGPSPALYDGLPCGDLDGLPRLRDFDGNGLAQMDMGAYEAVPPPTTPGTADGIVFFDSVTMTWDVEGSAIEYHVYRGDLATIAYGDFGLCRDDLDTDRTDTQLTDSEVPSVGEGFFYVITADDGLREGGMGLGTCAERSRFASCP